MLIECLLWAGQKGSQARETSAERRTMKVGGAQEWQGAGGTRPGLSRGKQPVLNNANCKRAILIYYTFNSLQISVIWLPQKVVQL